MKKRDLLFFVLMAGVAFGVHAMGNPEFHAEEDPWKFIPHGANYILFKDNEILEGKYKFSVFWYNKDYKCFADYKNAVPMANEMFVDINGDGIPDMTLPDAEIAYQKMKQREERENKQNSIRA